MVTSGLNVTIAPSTTPTAGAVLPPDLTPAPLHIDLPEATRPDPDQLTVRVRHVIEWEIDIPVLLGRLLALGQLGAHADTLLNLARTHANQHPDTRRERGQRVELVTASVTSPTPDPAGATP